MSETMIERMARALCDSQETTDLNWQSWAHAVKVVLREMREPTEAMTVDAHDHEAINPKATSRQIWRAMIDAALKEVGTAKAARQ